MKGGCKVKICGITSVGDRNTVADLGADFFGVIFDVSFLRVLRHWIRR